LRLAGRVPLPAAARACRFALRPGDIVVLTGAFPESKEHWSRRCLEAGLRVAGHVSKRTALVLAADPDSMSHKATKARQYGIPVASSAALERLLAPGRRYDPQSV
ncbi:MAG TPA: hypothetical protein VE172_00460, partial [Stackebrandtia sp.]